MKNVARVPTGVNVIFDLQDRDKNEEFKFKHPQRVMEALGIKYQRAEPSTITDSWRFVSVDKTTLPEKLPEFLSVVHLTSDQWNKEVDYLKKLRKVDK